ncbi:crystal protein-like [Ruditapes philippinarum]|uniref:crystal protein-like n=1 Tax=Ruditapes philippinarum TaxID=129788 RepID=UPI00295A87E7|nr:crystal protein-like [Ruditapes philippinarum]
MLVCLRFLPLFLSLISVTSGDVVVQTKYGKVRGKQTDQTNSFLGIPYAKPPLNELRWQPPVEPPVWTDVYNATELKPGCPQHGCFSSNPSFVCPKETSESCLFLNVYTPSNSSTSNLLPVMVYIHGGNFVHISASSPIFKGDYFASKGQVVLVTFDYRLGVLGFLYTGPKSTDAAGNYGIRDQRLALNWVQENIKYFGGDQTRVTLFGQSAGGQSIPIHLMSNEADNLFRNVIIESAPFDIPFKNPEEAVYLASLVMRYINCTMDDYMTCLRSKTSDELAQAQLEARAKPTSLKVLDFFEPLGPFVDGDVVPYEPVYAIQNNKLRKVPVMIGTMTEEARIFVYEAWGKPVPPLEYIGVLAATYPSHVEQMLNMYPFEGATDTRDNITKLGTDFIFTCASRNMSRHFYKNGQNVFRFEFNQSFSFNGWGNFSYCEGHVCHGEEIVYVFHSADQSGFNFNHEEEILSDQMIGYWTNFAYTSDPNKGPHSVSLQWPLYDSASKIIKFKAPSNTVIDNYLEKYCDFWDTIGYKA